MEVPGIAVRDRPALTVAPVATVAASAGGRRIAAGGGVAGAAQALSARAAAHSADEPPFKTVNLQADGLALNPREYVSLLGKLV